MNSFQAVVSKLEILKVAMEINIYFQSAPIHFKLFMSTVILWIKNNLKSELIPSIRFQVGIFGSCHGNWHRFSKCSDSLQTFYEQFYTLN